jgi:hypothetical protein
MHLSKLCILNIHIIIWTIFIVIIAIVWITLKLSCLGDY